MRALLLSTFFISALSQAATYTLYSDFSLNCTSEKIEMNLTHNEQIEDSFWAQTSISSSDFPTTGLDKALSRLSLDRDRTVDFKDAFNFEYKYQMLAKNLKDGKTFSLNLNRTHEAAGTNETFELTCKTSITKTVHVLKEATKKNIKKLTTKELAYAISYAGESDGGVDIDDLNLSLLEARQLNHYSFGLKILERDSSEVRNSYKKYLKRLEAAEQWRYDDCISYYDEEVLEQYEHYELCQFTARVVMDKDGKFLNGVVWYTNYNGTDDYDDDDGYFGIYDWNGKIVFENAWSN